MSKLESSTLTRPVTYKSYYITTVPNHSRSKLVIELPNSLSSTLKRLQQYKLMLLNQPTGVIKILVALVPVPLFATPQIPHNTQTPHSQEILTSRKNRLTYLKYHRIYISHKIHLTLYLISTSQLKVIITLSVCNCNHAHIVCVYSSKIWPSVHPGAASQNGAVPCIIPT